ncbi:hypothetical protein SUGI_0257540 [Cryptomeria japonica]|nr:hypothetical protein SUGI_0257540 [Cryptomeria japonica]
MFFAVTVFGVAVEAGDSLLLGASLSGNQTIISKNGTFELGFFSPNGSNWYIGIWYAKIPEKTYVWVANRATPATNRSGVLKLSPEGNLVLFDAEGASIWSVNTTNKASRAVILDSGNFLVLRDGNKSETVWQSFDNPVDTWLPGMTFGGQQKLVSWKNSFDPAPGLFFFHADSSGAKQFVLKWNNSVQYWESGIWDVTRILLTKFGQVQVYAFDGSNWSMFFSVPRDGCALYGTCGAYGTCDSRNLQLCSCGEGFKPKDDRAWRSQDWASSGCVPQSPLNCSTDRFIDLGVLLPDDYSSSHPASTKKDCQKACLHNCSCTAFAFNPPSGPCQTWSRDLLNMRYSTPSKSNSNVFIRVGASQLSTKRKSPSTVRVVFGIVGALTVVLGISSIFIWRRHQLRSMDRPEDLSNSFLKVFSYKELKIATRNFRSKLGSGGFGSVFKGSLPDGTLVAVKKMRGSRQDEKQFRAEISSLGSIQHVSLVRLRGFCVEGSRRLLIYDYMPNGSLNSLLFKSNCKNRGEILDWKTRFEIALGTARGNLDLTVQDSSLYYFPPWAATQIQQGKMIHIVEEGVAEAADMEEVRRACVVAFLCIQEDEEVRPSMRQVVQMLEGKMELQTPQIPSSAVRPAQHDTSS